MLDGSAPVVDAVESGVDVLLAVVDEIAALPVKVAFANTVVVVDGGETDDAASGWSGVASSPQPSAACVTPFP